MARFAPASFTFLASLWANIKILQHANVETFIVCRSCTPVIISVCDWCFMDRELPNMKSSIAIIGLIAGSIGYAVFDSNFFVTSYRWTAVWFTILF